MPGRLTVKGAEILRKKLQPAADVLRDMDWKHRGRVMAALLCQVPTWLAWVCASAPGLGDLPHGSWRGLHTELLQGVDTRALANALKRYIDRLKAQSIDGLADVIFWLGMLVRLRIGARPAATAELWKRWQEQEAGELLPLREAKEMGHPMALLIWGRWVGFMGGAASLGALKAAAEAGCTTAQYDWGRWLLSATTQADTRTPGPSDGEGHGEGHGEAVWWLRRAAVRGHVLAQLLLGYCYMSGLGVEEDIRCGLRWIRRMQQCGILEGERAFHKLLQRLLPHIVKPMSVRKGVSLAAMPSPAVMVV